jgi:hypothetical protein
MPGLSALATGAAANAGLALDPSFTICRFRDAGPTDKFNLPRQASALQLLIES